MRSWVGKTVTLVSAATLVYACAGKSISRTNGESVADDGYGNGGVANASYGGKGGGVTAGGKGGAPGKGGNPGTGGTDGSAGRPTGGTGGFGGTTGGGGVAGGFSGGAGTGGRDCEPRRSGSVVGDCVAPPECISMTDPEESYVRLNQHASQDGGEAGAGGEGGGIDFEKLTTARLCSVPEEGRAFLVFDYLRPDDGSDTLRVGLFSGPTPCRGYSFEGAVMNHPPPPGVWTTQCVPIEAADLRRTVTVGVNLWAPERSAKVRNLRFAEACECPLQATRYTTCGNLVGPAYCP